MTAPRNTQALRMDDIRIGPAGETFGQLKQAVRDAREAWRLCACESHLATWVAATRGLDHAYEAVGLPYVAP